MVHSSIKGFELIRTEARGVQEGKEPVQRSQIAAAGTEALARGTIGHVMKRE